MVVLIGTLFFIALLLTNLTNRVNTQESEIARNNIEKEALRREVETLKLKINVQESKKAEAGEAKETGCINA